MIDLFIDISEAGKVINPKEFSEALAALKPGKHHVIIKDVRKRSLPQNSYYRGVIVPMVRKGLYDIGWDEVKNNDQAHEFLKKMFFREMLVNKITGEMVYIAGSSAEKTIPEFSVICEEIIKWAAEDLGINIPSPNDQLKTFAQYSRWLAEQEFF